MKGNSKTGDDKVIFITLAAILIVAIAIILTWYFTKEEKLKEPKQKDDIQEVLPNNNEDQTNKVTKTPVVIENKQSNEIILANTSQNSQTTPSNQEETSQNSTPNDLKFDWNLPELALRVKSGKTILLNTSISDGNTSQTANVTIERNLNNEWTSQTVNDNLFTPSEAGLYRYVYTFNGTQLTQEFIVIESLLINAASIYQISSDAAASTLDNSFKTEENLAVINSNLRSAEVYYDNDNTVHVVKVNAPLLSYADTLQTPYAIIIESGINNITTIDSATKGINVFFEKTTQAGEDQIIVWIDMNEFDYNKIFDIELVIDGQSIMFSLGFVKNYQAPNAIDNLETPEIDQTNPEKTELETLLENHDNINISYHEETLTIEVLNPLNEINGSLPLGIIVTVDEYAEDITDISIAQDALKIAAPSITNNVWQTINLGNNQVIVWLNLNNLSNQVTFDINGNSVAFNVIVS